MSELRRLERLAKSLIPRIPRGEDRQYTLEDARHMINELGLQMSPEALAFMTGDSNRLDDFLMNVYHLEEKVGKKVTTDSRSIDERYEPKVYEEDGTLAFSVTWRGKERVFAEYQVPATK